ncbi:LysR family transcriptional regulator [Mesorhizobium sp. M4B.F.Ca.ET.215.01.1.1]|uniref:LysR family transcriptional regulator n=1 Tax=unclassified Mesorhizobium TaxID=325217 RepID=UPI000FC9CED2|nr:MULTISPECIES: LysR family transcriptional regulator [unclassified Mesorhizobium]RUW25843.1 LysR family transcriptional regulator [Mesorhizobium sp. M4B.F.Ca.ET.013.02.1.1]RVD39929.1 LysR family transcriptional regulator [Mesorhizobium sp. M4B.F.Ca.ET.019.03.1.1]RWF67027.1 MAG: LysR family transcriptional regulator [Mesorhizobium sp.]TGQ18807.1 LysR family transcriptional regulator [Mesorhizobium sp. M4B.F.Ca.ET.215.01.1.1]TGQ40467.1 LysR family transcriptional regulator [Mesorhizobium sp. M
MKFTLAQLRYVVAVARYGSVTMAAQALNVSQPSISVAIDHVEDAFGQKLFVRQRGSGVALTSFGRKAVAKARQVLAEADELAALGSREAEVGGELVLGCFEDLAAYFAPALMRAFAERCPAVTVVIRDETFETLGRRLADSAVDLGLTYDLGLPAHFARILLHELRPHALLPAGHALADQRTVSLAELAAHPLIMTDQPHSWQHMLDLFLSRGLTPVAQSTTSSFELQRSMVANGFGVAVSYTRPHGDLSYDGLPLVCKPLADPLPMQRIILAHDTRQRLSKAALAFIEVAKAWFASHDVFTG